ncbi:MAG: sulfatase-like hydrolase/transferase [Candidatus Hydrogenedentes bacterium]|nr:sulfatase-like hydrolase/transferase [Candidatus Hydrogenedentota bacterium]
MAAKPNILFLMMDQLRWDAIAAHGNPDIYTPNLDRLVQRGATFSNAYSPCPVCVPARYTIRTGRLPHTTGVYHNGAPDLVPGQPESMEARCGEYLPRRLQQLGYRTFGVGKFHTRPWDEELGYDVHLHSEEIYGSPDQRARDAYAKFIREQYPAYDFIEGLMGERTEMYYMPQMSPMPAPVTVEWWAADRAIEQIAQRDDDRPCFGFVSFIGPHPPLAPPIPFNRMYDPDRMPNPVRGAISIDHMDEQLPWMNYAIWAEDVIDSHARVLRARYYGEVSYIDHCIGHILDALEARGDGDNTLIVFFSDHGDHLGDHHAWQKESFFEASCRVPFLVSWPAAVAPGVRTELADLTDLFGLAMAAAGAPEMRDGIDLLGVLAGAAAPREYVLGYHGIPGTPRFKVMVRDAEWKYIYFANGGHEQLFHLPSDPQELRQRAQDAPEELARLHSIAHKALSHPNIERALEAGELRKFPLGSRPLQRIYQFDPSRNVRGFPEHPADVLKEFDFGAVAGGPS